MKREIMIKNIRFYIGNYTPRNNEFEKGLKYKLFVDDIPTNYNFNSIKEAKKFITDNYWQWL